MQATILKNDYIFSTKYSYGFSKYSIPFSPDLFNGRILASNPRRGDIIIMRPPHDMNTRYIKRLIGLPGEKIEIKKDVTYINDVPVERAKIGKYFDEENQEYVKYKETLQNGLTFYSYKLKKLDEIADTRYSDFGPYFIPSGQFFFMGDNRDQSGDSRYQLGFVPFENFIAKAQFILLSTKEVFWNEELGIVDQLAAFWPWLSSIRFNRLFKGMYDI
jgi:signal peptidase I